MEKDYMTDSSILEYGNQMAKVLTDKLAEEHMVFFPVVNIYENEKRVVFIALDETARSIMYFITANDLLNADTNFEQKIQKLHVHDSLYS